jgi:flagellar biosynthesis/type III secretory pathway protein FliH
VGQDVEKAHDLLEMQAMLAEKVKDWTREWKQQGIAQGIEQGIEKGIEKGIEQGIDKGIAQGKAELLAKLLVKRFGSLPAQVENKLNHATSDQLETWSERIFEAASLDALFDE